MALSASPVVGQRTAAMTPIGVERMGNAADALHDRTLLRLENLDTDLRPPTAALEATEAQVRDDDANSYLPFFGHERLRRAAVRLVERNGGLAPGHYDPARQCFISAGGLSGILNVLLALIEPGDEVVLTSPTYVGLINRVKLAGGVPRYIRMVPGPSGWRLDAGSLRTAVSPRTRAFLMMSPSMPSGAVFTRDEWQAVCDACIAANAWMIYDSAMERLLFDGAPRHNPLQFDGMTQRTVTVGAASKEYRMIGWRVGWVVGPLAACEAIGRVAISNVVCPVGIAQQAVAAAIESPDDGIAASVATWQARHDLLVQALRSQFDVVPAHGGWSLLIDFARRGISGTEASQRLLAQGVAATSMENWGLDETAGFLRLVFSNEPVERLRDIAPRFQCAFG
ncbi:MAG TPA: pyridoxal phosphate-dependent aminotransferase [Burkholderiaceae bacterium]|jgi:aspartate/methionine/tyrosine aminotransferase|nr:pyridoxal phosphate-dependent aminotransferase [Burkholderiaceae bacterium]